MIVIICAKYKKNPSRTVDATERTRFSKSRLNDLEDIGQGQGSSHATHPLMLLIICTKYGKNPSWTVDATGRTLKVNGQTDRQTDRRTDRQTGWIQYTPPNFVAGGIITSLTIVYSTVYSGTDQRKHQSSTSLAFVQGTNRSPVNFLHNGPITWKMFPFDDVIMESCFLINQKVFKTISIG